MKFRKYLESQKFFSFSRGQMEKSAEGGLHIQACVMTNRLVMTTVRDFILKGGGFNEARLHLSAVGDPKGIWEYVHKSETFFGGRWSKGTGFLNTRKWNDKKADATAYAGMLNICQQTHQLIVALLNQGGSDALSTHISSLDAIPENIVTAVKHASALNMDERTRQIDIEQRKEASEFFKGEMLPIRGWQTALLADLRTLPNQRKITVVVDSKGGCGKSLFTKYYYLTHETECAIAENGKSADIAYAGKLGH